MNLFNHTETSQSASTSSFETALRHEPLIPGCEKISFKIASSAAELDGLYQLRHQVFCEEEGFFPENEERRVYDYFDHVPFTANIIAINNHGVVIGGVRLTLPSGYETPADRFFDFKPWLPDAGCAAGASMLCLLREYRTVPAIMQLIIATAWHHIMNNGMTHVYAAFNPKIKHLMRRACFRQVADDFVELVTGLWMTPMVADLSMAASVYKQAPATCLIVSSVKD
jgi:hypothetical protein